MDNQFETRNKQKYDVLQINKVLKAVQEINHRMIREEEQEKLLECTCKILKETIGYDMVFVALTGKKGQKIVKLFSSEKSDLKLEPNGFYCFNEILQVNSKQLYNPQINCFDCYLIDDFKTQDRLIIPINFQNHLYGMICIVLPNNYKLYLKEQNILETLAEDFAYALFNLEIRREHAKVREEISAYYQKIEDQNNELQEKNRQLEIANKKARESDILKNSFLGIVSHELRTPLNGILGFSQLLKTVNPTSEKIDGYIDVIHSSGIQLLQVVNNILDISKIEANQLKLHVENFELNSVFDDVYLTNQYLISKLEDVKFDINSQFESKVVIRSDKEKLKQILNVLVHNAIKFTNKGIIEMGCTRTGKEKILFYVKDTGIGIESEKSDVIFQMFRQSDESRTRRYGGTGLGLSIAKGLVNFLNGKIWFESEVDTGSLFYFIVPVVFKDQKN
ncbi:MAG: ATP-binding protein [Bacteroidales bacterium]